LIKRWPGLGCSPGVYGAIRSIVSRNIFFTDPFGASRKPEIKHEIRFG
jgi:hypothetical protein